MNPIEEKEQEIFNNNISLIEHSLPNGFNAISFLEKRVIFIDNFKMDNSKMTNYVLQHEIEHFDNPFSFYSLKNFSNYEVRKKENFINRKVFNKLIPIDKVYNFMRLGMTIFEISEELLVPESILVKACEFYKLIGAWPLEDFENASL